MAKLWQFLQGHPKPSFSEKVQRGTNTNLSKLAQKDALALKAQKHSRPNHIKNRLESSLRLKFSKALWRKQHYPLISMHLKCKDWTRFGCKHRLQKCPNGQVITIYARSLKTRILVKKCKRGTDTNFSKLAQKDALA